MSILSDPAYSVVTDPGSPCGLSSSVMFAGVTVVTCGTVRGLHTHHCQCIQRGNCLGVLLIIKRDDAPSRPQRSKMFLLSRPDQRAIIIKEKNARHPRDLSQSYNVARAVVDLPRENSLEEFVPGVHNSHSRARANARAL